MRLFPTLALSSLMALAGTILPASAAMLITVDKTSQTMSVAIDGATQYTWPVSTGLPGHDTPSGSYQPFRMEANHFSREWDNAPMPHSIFFTKVGHAIHGTNHGRNLGRAASHGCVRLSPRNAATLFALVKSQGMGNTRVSIEGRLSPSAPREQAPAMVSRQRDPYYRDDGVRQVGMQSGRYAQPEQRGYRRVEQRDPVAYEWYGRQGRYVQEWQ